MGLFDNMFNNMPAEKKFIPENIREAYSVALYCCASAEGKISDDEILFIDCMFQTMPVFKDHDGADYLLNAEKTYKNYRLQDLLEGSFSFVKETMRPQLFCYCCDIFLADGVVTDEEKEILEKIAEVSGIDEEISKKIVEVAIIRNTKEE